jgi:hypothetical protein
MQGRNKSHVYISLLSQREHEVESMLRAAPSSKTHWCPAQHIVKAARRCPAIEWKSRSDSILSHVFFRGSSNFALSIFAFAVEGWIPFSTVNSVTPQIVLNMSSESSAWRISVRQLISYNVVSLVTVFPIAWVPIYHVLGK